MSSDKDAFSIPLVDGDSVDSILRRLVEKIPELDQRLFDSEGQLHRFLNIFVDDKPIIQENLCEYSIQHSVTLTLMMVVGGGEIVILEVWNS